MEGAGPESLNIIHRFGIIIDIAIYPPIARNRYRLLAGFATSAQQAAEYRFIVMIMLKPDFVLAQPRFTGFFPEKTARYDFKRFV